MTTRTDSASGRRIIVIGADGFIGSAVVRAALNAGATVAAYCAKEPWRLGDLENNPGLAITGLAKWWDDAGVEALKAELSEADAVVLLAYRPPPDRDSAQRHEHEVNAAGAIAIGEAVAAAGARLVFTSSADVYGPWHDEQVSEDVDPQPQTPYAEAKLEAERRLLSLEGAGSSVSLRLATVFGPGEDGPRAIPSFINAFLRSEAPVLHGDGTDVRDYVHVEDVAAAIVNACLRPSPPPLLNLGSGVGRSTDEVLRAVAAVMEAEPRPRREPSKRAPSRLVVDSTLARRELGFDPRDDFEPALREEARWLEIRRQAEVAA